MLRSETASESSGRIKTIKMQLRKILATLLIFLSLLGCALGQERVEDENWLKGLGTEADNLPSLIYLSNFSKEDLTKGKQRLRSVQQFLPKNEWEGIYYSNTEIGDSKLIWNAEGGFFSLYFYHYLKRFDYGVVSDSLSFVKFTSEKIFDSNSSKKQSAQKLVKVKVGEKHFLVSKNRLQEFCDRAAGLSTSIGDFHYYWNKEEDMKKKIFGLPILPSEYSQHLRYPIEAKIISVGRRKIIPNEQSTKDFNFDDIYYPVTLNVGRNKNVKTQMNFFVEDLGEWIEITKVLQTKSIGFIRRDFDETNREQCRDSEGGNGQIVPCKEIQIGIKSKTKASELYF
jgi:hypothetical protein